MRHHVSVDFYRLFQEVATDCDLDPHTIHYCSQRLKAEGIKFWTVTLPKLSKCVLRSLELGVFERPTDFAWKGRSLRYFRSLLDRIFDPKTGHVQSDSCATSLYKLRQVCEYTYKLSLDFDSETLEQAEVDYERTQQSVADFRCDNSWAERLRRNAETYYPRLFKAHISDILQVGPRFGPGAFAGSQHRDLGVPFYEWKLRPDDQIGTVAEDFASYSGYFKPYPSAPTKVKVVPTAKVCEVLFVPKDSRGPRVISKEPPHLIKAQMAFFGWMSSCLERDSAYRCNFGDQSVNHTLAYESSLSGANATVDLKNASDMVSWRLASCVFKHAPGVRYFLNQGRSTLYRLPSGRTGRLHSVAGMGSGLTFPLLSFFVHLSVCSAVQKYHGIPYKESMRRVYVYGDDLVVPNEWLTAAYSGLTESGLKVNTDKSYSKSRFRESCGGDFYKGVDVSPARLKLSSSGLPALKGLVLTSRDVKNNDMFILGICKHRNELGYKALNNTSAYLGSTLSGLPMPQVGEGSSVLGVIAHSTMDIVKQGTQDAVDPSTYSVKAVVAVPVLHKSSELCPYKFLQQFFKRKLVAGVAQRTGAFGEIPIPRDIKLVVRKVNIMALMPSLMPV